MKRKVTAFLGPTNTGKTYTAIQKLLNYDSGVIGFPLRLLARENFDLAKKLLPHNSIALITGEEKIIPEKARYFFCTVESIPDSLNFDFVAIDEIQMASDPDRGYIFTEKMLNKKGLKETMFLGSKSMEKILKKIFPKVTIFNKSRLSQLSYIGYKNLTRLPPRSAVIAFSQIDVYEIANKLKQSHGGVSIIMGALSPDVRNAQVKLFEEGKVDYIVATDAIGMGLNLDIKNIFFSSMKKFDGTNERFLSLDEISQIAGRAGRNQNQGFFGITGDLKKLESNVVNYVENYEFTEIKKIYWRNSKLNFKTPKDLLNSLYKMPTEEYLKIKKNANDHRYLKIFLSDRDIKPYSLNYLNLRKLWEICSVPDYSKNLDEYHTRFLKTIFKYLIGKEKRIPATWVRKNLNYIKRETSKISELNYKISQVRIWSFISFKNGWIKGDNSFQSLVKKLERKLSTKLHEQLISEFVGELKNFKFFNQNSLFKGEDLIRLEDRKIFFGKQSIGLLDGLNFKISSSFRLNKNIFNNKMLEKNLRILGKKIVDEFISVRFMKLRFDVSGQIFWNGGVVAKFVRHRKITKPRIELFLDKIFINYDKIIIEKLNKYFEFLINKEIPFHYNISNPILTSSASRALNFSIMENLGHCRKKDIYESFSNLAKVEIDYYKSIGLKNGIFFSYFKCKKKSFFRQMLINIFYKNQLDDFIKEDVFFIKNKTKNKLETLEKLGFYQIKIDKEEYLINYNYFETLLRKIYFFRKKQFLSIIPNNKFEKKFFDNPRIIQSLSL